MLVLKRLRPPGRLKVEVHCATRCLGVVAQALIGSAPIEPFAMTVKMVLLLSLLIEELPFHSPPRLLIARSGLLH